MGKIIGAQYRKIIGSQYRVQRQENSSLDTQKKSKTLASWSDILHGVCKDGEHDHEILVNRNRYHLLICSKCNWTRWF